MSIPTHLTAALPAAVTLVPASPRYVLPTVGAIELVLRDLGHKSGVSAGVAAAQAVFADAP